MESRRRHGERERDRSCSEDVERVSGLLRDGAEALGFVRGAGVRALRADEFYEKDYFHGRKSGRDKRFEHRVRKAMRMINGVRQFGELRSVLDTGCSFGHGVEAGRRLGLDSAGTDISQYAVDVCRSRGLRAEQGTLQKLPFSNAEFDLVMLKHVMEHVPDPAVALAELRRVLRPNGRLLIAVPDLDYWKGHLLRRSYRYFRPDDLGQQHCV